MNFSKYTELIKNHSVCIFFFYSQECNTLYNKIKALETSSKSKIIFIDVNQNNNVLIKEIKLQSYPFFKIYKDSKLIENIIGTYDNIDTIVNLHIS